MIPTSWLIGGGAIGALLLVGGFVWWLDGHDDRLIAACNLRHAMASAQAVNNAFKDRQKRDTEMFNAGRAIERTAQDANREDERRTTEVVREIINASPSAKSCVFDDGTAARLNSLR